MVAVAVAMTITRTSMLLLAMMMVPGAVGAHVGGPAAPAAAAEAMALAPDAAPAGAKRGGMSLSEQKAAKKKRQEEQMAAKRLARLAQTGGEASPSGGAANSSTAQEPEPPGPSPAAASPCSPCSSGSCPDGAAACPAACAGCQPDPFNLRPGAYVQGSYDPENRNNIKWTAQQLHRHVATVRKQIEKIGKTPERCTDLVDGLLKDPKTTQYTAQVPSEIDKAIADSVAEMQQATMKCDDGTILEHPIHYLEDTIEEVYEKFCEADGELCSLEYFRLQRPYFVRKPKWRHCLCPDCYKMRLLQCSRQRQWRSRGRRGTRGGRCPRARPPSQQVFRYLELSSICCARSDSGRQSASGTSKATCTAAPNAILRPIFIFLQLRGRCRRWRRMAPRISWVRTLQVIPRGSTQWPPWWLRGLHVMPPTGLIFPHSVS